MDLYEEAKPVILGVVRSVLDVLPEGWMGAKLVVREVDGDGGEVLQSHKLVSTEGRAELAMPDDAVFEATGRLAEVFRVHKKPWRSIELTVCWLPDREKWDYSIEFNYGAEAHTATGSSVPQ